MKKTSIFALVSLVIAIALIATAGGLIFASGSDISILNYESGNLERDYYSDTLEGIEKIVVDVSAVEININTSSAVDEIQITLKHSSKSIGNSIGVSKFLNTKKSGDELLVRINRPSWFSMLFFTIAYLDITIPESYTGELAIDSSACDITANGLNNIKKVDLDISAGALDISGLTGGLDLNMSAGDATLSFDKVGGDIDIDISAGNVDLYLPADGQIKLENDHISAGHFNNDYDFTRSAQYGLSVTGSAAEVDVYSK